MRLIAAKTKRVEIPNDPDKGFVTIRNLSLEEVARIDAKYFEISESGVNMKNYADREADFVRACLTGWGNLFDESGRELKFNPKNVEKASAFAVDVGDDDGYTRFFAWINKERDTFAEEVEAKEQVAEKN